MINACSHDWNRTGSVVFYKEHTFVPAPEAEVFSEPRYAAAHMNDKQGATKK